MAWKYKRWKIKWNPSKKKFIKKRRDREASRKAHVRCRQNKGKVRAALRKSRIKGRVQRKKNKAMGIYKKLSLARKRWKNLIKSDMNIDMYLDSVLNESSFAPEINLDAEDIEDIKYALKQIQRNVEMEDKEDRKELDDYIDDALKVLDGYESTEDLEEDDEEFLSDLISFIEEFAEEAGLIEDDDETEIDN